MPFSPLLLGMIALLFSGLRLIVLIGVIVVAHRYRPRFPKAARLMTLAAMCSITALMIGQLVQNLIVPLIGPMRIYSREIEWMALLFEPSFWVMFLTQLVTSSLNAGSLWLIAAAALRQPDRAVSV